MALASAEKSTWSGRWYELLSGLGYDMGRGQALARWARVQYVDVQVGRILAEIHDRDRGVCTVEIEIAPFSDGEWTAVLDALAGEALYAAQLLAGGVHSAMPAAIESVFTDANLSLLPSATAADEIITRCGVCDPLDRSARRSELPRQSAGGQGKPCKHAVAVLYMQGEMIDEDPWLLFRLRGRERQQVLTGLRRRRNESNVRRFDSPAEEALPAAGEQDMAAPQQPGMAGPFDSALVKAASGGEENLGLAEQIDTFWGRSQDLRAMQYYINPPLIRLALLRRLGPPPFPQDSLEAYQRLAEIYQEVSEKALELAFRPEPD